MSQTLMPDLSPEEKRLLQARLWPLLARQIQLYTSGESSSVPVELAQELLDSVCFCLGLSLDAPGERGRALLELDPEEELRRGIQAVREKTEAGKVLWRRVCDNLPAVRSLYLLETLKSIGTFWKRYDCRFFAHRIPCDITYPLAVPVPETLLGVDYVNAYLEQLERENRFLVSIPTELLKELLDRSGFDYRTLPINLCELAHEQLRREQGL